jgi:hypothetical protein
MLVKAKDGLKAPMEFHADRYITDAEPVEVIDSAYYRRRISDGDLFIVDQPVKPVKESK